MRAKRATFISIKKPKDENRIFGLKIQTCYKNDIIFGAKIQIEYFRPLVNPCFPCLYFTRKLYFFAVHENFSGRAHSDILLKV